MKVEDLKPRGLKPPMQLLPYRPLRAIVSAMHDGATKYAPDNWRYQGNSDDWRETYSAAALRHLLAYCDADESDYATDSTVHHLAHLGACCFILLYLEGVDYHEPQSVRNKRESEKAASEDWYWEDDNEPIRVDVEITPTRKDPEEQEHMEWDAGLFHWLWTHDADMFHRAFPEYSEMWEAFLSKDVMKEIKDER